MGREFSAPWWNCLSGGPVNCLYAYCCGCFAVADIAKAAGMQDNYVFDCLCVNVSVLRNQYRQKKGVEGHCSGDCCLGLFPCCALAQMMSDLGGDYKMLNVTGEDFKQAFFGAVDQAKQESKKAQSQVKGAPVEEMDR